MSMDDIGTADAARQPGHPVLARLLARIECGRLIVVTPEGDRLVGRGRMDGPEAELRLHSHRLFRRMLWNGDLGFAEGYFAGDWSTPDLPRLLEFAAANLGAVGRTVARNPFAALASRIGHFRRTNTRAGSRRNIAFHYDLGNEFYRLWLDRSMTYSSALYENARVETLEAAQDAKIARIATLLALEPGQRVLEIGCGWGALAARLAGAGAHVTAITLSTEQKAEAEARAARLGLAGRIEVRLQDYRDVTESFDRIVSIEMIEAVGARYWTDYFGALRARLARGGRAVVQAITIDEARFEDYRRRPDFIQRYVFPGGMLPTKTIMADEAARAGLRLTGAEFFGASYARTLAEWRSRFLEVWPMIEAMGFDQRFKRIWEYYLAYCEAGFRRGTIDVGLYVLE